MTALLTAPASAPAIEGQALAPAHGSLHSSLIELSARWLAGKQCSVVITDMAHGSGETADAIGWKSGYSMLVECKASRADFLNDRHKDFRRFPSHGMGVFRYYATPPGLLKVEELPPMWGLLEIRGDKLRVVRAAERQPCNARAETSLLVSALRRVGHTCPAGISVRCYTIETTKSRATLGIRKEENTGLCDK